MFSTNPAWMSNLLLTIHSVLFKILGINSTFQILFILVYQIKGQEILPTLHFKEKLSEREKELRIKRERKRERIKLNHFDNYLLSIRGQRSSLVSHWLSVPVDHIGISEGEKKISFVVFSCDLKIQFTFELIHDYAKSLFPELIHYVWLSLYLYSGCIQ